VWSRVGGCGGRCDRCSNNGGQEQPKTIRLMGGGSPHGMAHRQPDGSSKPLESLVFISVATRLTLRGNTKNLGTSASIGNPPSASGLAWPAAVNCPKTAKAWIIGPSAFGCKGTSSRTTSAVSPAGSAVRKSAASRRVSTKPPGPRRSSIRVAGEPKR
jgi:hypothetical protein